MWVSTAVVKEMGISRIVRRVARLEAEAKKGSETERCRTYFESGVSMGCTREY